jgi:NitT/TauT family transport system substrate-binding protein
MRKVAVAVLAALAVGVVGAISASSAPSKTLTDVTIQFTFKTRGELAFLYLADKNGYFKQQGIRVKFVEGVGAGPVFASTAIKHGNIFVAGIMNQAAVAMNQGLPLRAVATWEPIVQSVLVSKPNMPINKPSDLIGKTVGLKQGQNASLVFPHFLKANGIDPSQVNVKMLDSSSANAVFLQGGVDVVDAFTTNEQPILEAAVAGRLSVLRISDFGFPDLGVGLIVNREIPATKKGGDLIRRFLIAADKGITATKANPQAAAEAIKAMYGALLPDTPIILEQVKNTNAAMPKLGKHMYGWADPAGWKEAIATARKTQVIVDPPDRAPLPASYFYTNKYVK